MAFEGNFALDLIANFRDYFDYESHRGAANDLLKVLDTHIFGVQEAWTHKKQYACQCAQVRVSLCAQTSPQTPAGRSPMGGGPLQPPGVGEQEFEQTIDARVRCNGRPLFFANNTVEHSTLQICIVGLGGHEP